MRSEALGPTSMVLTVAFSSFGAFLPHLSEIRRSAPDNPEIVADLRAGEVVASLTVVAAAVLATSVAGGPEPIVVGLLAAAGMITAFELMRHSTSAFVPSYGRLKAVR